MHISSAEIRHLLTPDDPLFDQARQVHNTAYFFSLDWSESGQHYVAMAPDIPERVVGAIQVLDCPELRSEGYGDAHVHRFAVDRTYRGRGIGSLMIAHVVQKGLEAGLKMMSTEVSADSVGPFEKMGFVSLRGAEPTFRYLNLTTICASP